MDRFDPASIVIRSGHFIGGELIDAGAARIEVSRPSDGVVYASVPVADDAMVDYAVQNAYSAFRKSDWARRAPRERGADERALRVDGGEPAAKTCREAPVVRAMPPFDGHRERMRGGNVVERESPVFDHIVIARVGHAGLLTLMTLTVTVTLRSAHG